MARGREVAAGGCVGTRDAHGSCRKLSGSAGQNHGKMTSWNHIFENMFGHCRNIFWMCDKICAGGQR